MRIPVCFAALCTALLIMLSARPALHAAEAEPLPPHVAAHASIKSPLEFLTKVDAYAAAATEEAEHSFPPGLILMIAQMWNPALMTALDLEKNMHTVFSAAETAGDGGNRFEEIRDEDVVYVFSVSDFDDLRSALEAEGGEIVDFGGDRAALGTDEESIRRVLGDWMPEHGSDADLRMRGSRERAGVNFSEAVREIPADIPDAPGMSFLPGIAAALDSMPEVVLDMRFTDGGLVFEFGGRPEDSSFAAKAEEMRAEGDDETVGCEIIPEGDWVTVRLTVSPGAAGAILRGAEAYVKSKK